MKPRATSQAFLPSPPALPAPPPRPPAIPGPVDAVSLSPAPPPAASLPSPTGDDERSPEPDTAFSERIIKSLGLYGHAGSLAAAGLASFGPTFLTTASIAATASCTVEMERALGRESARTLEVKGVRMPSSDAALDARLQRMGKRVAEQTKRPEIPFTFYLVRGDRIQAEHFPGGHVYVSEGAVRVLDRDAELAFILAHEVAHVERRDAITSRGFDQLKDQYERLAVRDGLGFSEAASLGVLLQSYYNKFVARPSELSADRRALEIVQAVGLDPTEALGALHKLQEQHRRTGSDVAPWTADRIGQVRDHPLDGQRIREAEAVVASLQEAPADSPGRT